MFVLLTFLSLSASAQVNLDLAKTKFLASEKLSHLASTDLASVRITSEHVSSISDIHHVYFMQEYQGIGIFNAVGSAHFNNSGRLIQSHADFQGKLASRITKTVPTITAEEAIISAARELKYTFQNNLELIESKSDVEQGQLFRNASLSLRDIPARLLYQPLENGEIRLAWDISILELSQKNWWSIRVDAETGEILHKNNWMVSCQLNHGHGAENHVGSCAHNTSSLAHISSAPISPSYQVYAMPLQSPADGDRTIEVDPSEPIASPFGWHDTDGSVGPEFTNTRGNNAHAYEDGDNAGFSPDTTSLEFHYPIDTTYSGGNQSEAAAITNLFYWNNVIHDVWYHYGFTEAAGNFQENNYGNGGAGGDYVFAEAQDGSGSCNANFGTPSDGSNPTMQMYVCTPRDGDLDNLVIVHEYAHGISNRLTGGRTNTGCLNNSEQMGEGWSDYLGLMMTIQAGDQGSDAVGVGTWLIGEPINGPGIRTHPYSTDMSINPHTYADIDGIAIPHGVGSVWCMMLWEMTWALIDQEGFDPDFYFGSGGNNIAMQLVMEGMKLQPCGPGFVDGRDAILLADQNLYGGAYQCLIWDAFAKRGLGLSADQGSTGSTSDGVEAFDTPGSLTLNKTVDKILAGPGDTLTYTLKINNPVFCNFKLPNVNLFDTIPANTFYVTGSASDGGSVTSGIVSFPVVDTLFPGDSMVRTFSVYVDPAYTLAPEFMDDVEAGSGNWTTTSTGSNNWTITTTNPHAPSANSWFAPDISPSEDQFLEMNAAFTPTDATYLSFWHYYDTEANYDGGVVQYSLDNGGSWLDLGPFMTQNGYNSRIDNNSSTPAFAGSSGGYIETRAALGSFAGQPMKFRFWMSCDPSVTGDGWYIDDVALLSNFIDNTAYASADGGHSIAASLTSPTRIEYLQCINGIQDGDETGVDCGGTFCPPCPTCDDGIRNGNETDIDCGGPDCPACPTCEDGIMNGDETGIDCGGPDCPECPCTDNELTLSLTFDDYPQETSWELRDSLGTVLYSGGTYPDEPDGSTLTIDFCIPDGCYELFIYDSYGDGMCCGFGNGSYFLRDNSTSTILASGGDFDDVDSTDFCLDPPPMSTCDSLLAVNGIVLADVYHASHILNSEGVIQSPDTVVFKSGTEINLNQNFEVQLGADFAATIEACSNALSLIRAKNELKNKTNYQELKKE